MSARRRAHVVAAASPVLAAADLDRTLIYSRHASGSDAGDLVCVEHYEGRPASFVGAAAVADLTSLATQGALVPVTTRTVAQLRRVALPGPSARFAVAANGGVLLVDGQVDTAWSRRVAAALVDSAPLARVAAHAARVCAPEWTRSLRTADELFCYAVVDREALPTDFVAEAQAWAAGMGWRTSLQGRKLYWVPCGLTKSAAVAEVAARSRADEVVAAGDSLLDLDLLTFADRAIHPAHGEIFDQGWRAEHVHTTVGTGVSAGVEIAAWLHRMCS